MGEFTAYTFLGCVVILPWNSKTLNKGLVYDAYEAHVGLFHVVLGSISGPQTPRREGPLIPNFKITTSAAQGLPTLGVNRTLCNLNPGRLGCKKALAICVKQVIPIIKDQFIGRVAKTTRLPFYSFPSLFTLGHMGQLVKRPVDMEFSGPSSPLTCSAHTNQPH